MKTYTVRARQTLFDCVLQATGTMEAVDDVAYANGLSASSAVTVGDVLVIPDTVATNRAVVEYVATNVLVLGTMGMPMAIVMETEEGDTMETEDGVTMVTED